MAMTNAERQRRWRKKHPHQMKARLDAFKDKKAQEEAKKSATECDHEDRRVRVQALYCGKCRQALIFMPGELERAHEKWLSSPPELDDGE